LFFWLTGRKYLRQSQYDLQVNLESGGYRFFVPFSIAQELTPKTLAESFIIEQSHLN